MTDNTREREDHLHVDVSSVVDQELEAEGTVRGCSGKVQRGEAFVVGLTHISAMVNQLTHHSILTIKACHVQSRVPKRIGFIYLFEIKKGKKLIMQLFISMILLVEDD